MDARQHLGRPRTTAWLTASLAGCGASLLCRANAIGLPARPLLPFVDTAADRAPRAQPALLDKLPSLSSQSQRHPGVAGARNRDLAGAVRGRARLTMAVTAPFIYLARTLQAPNPSLAARPAAQSASLAGVGALRPWRVRVGGELARSPWRSGRRWPALALAAAAYVATLAPVAGLTPSSLQWRPIRYMVSPVRHRGVLAARRPPACGSMLPPGNRCICSRDGGGRRARPC